MMNIAKDFLQMIGLREEDPGVFTRVGRSSKRLATSSLQVARDVGPLRGLLGLALLGGAVAGAIYLVRYLRERSDESPTEGVHEGEGGRSRRARRSRKAEHSATSAMNRA